MSAMTTCCCCAAETIVERGRPNAQYARRGVRMASGTEHAIAFAWKCMPRITAADWPRILENNKAVFEESWAQANVPEDQRERFRADMADWRIVGWASDISADAARVMAA